MNAYFGGGENRCLVVMATGLGKTFVAAESVRRIRANKRRQVLVCAHTNDLVYQLERAFWPFLKPSETTLIWNAYERPTFEQLESVDFAFACVDSVSAWLQSGRELPDYGILLIDDIDTSLQSEYFDDIFCFVVRLCMKFKIQLFASVRSKEALKSFLNSQAYDKNADSDDPIRVIRLEKKDGKTTADVIKGSIAYSM